MHLRAELLVIVIALVLCERVAHSQPPSQSQDRTGLRLSTTLVQVPTVVTDRSGRFVTNLSKNDFVVFEDGKRQDVATFAEVKEPFSAVLVVDTSNSAADRLGAIQSTAISFVRKIRSEDRAMIIAFDNEVRRLTELTSDKAELETALRATESGFGKLLYEAITAALERLRNVEGRRAVIVFSDCVDMRSTEATPESVTLLAEEVGAAVYVVQFETRWWVEAEARKRKASQPQSKVPFSVDGRIPLPSENERGPKIQFGTSGLGANTPDQITKTLDTIYGEADKFARTISQRSGARIFSAGNAADLETAFDAIAEELRNQYLIGYYPSQPQGDGRYRRIKVEVAKKGVDVRARAGYTAR